MSKYPPFDLLSPWPANRQAQLLDSLPRRYFDDGAFIFDRGDPGTEVYFVLSGAVKNVSYNERGKISYFRTYRPGEFFGYYSAISEKPRTAGVTAIGPTETAVMSGKRFFSFVLDNRDIGRAFLKLVIDILRNETNRLTHLTMLSAQERVAAELVSLGLSCAGTSVPLPERIELASYLGMTRETLSRILADFSKRKLIKLSGNKVVILDQAQLEVLAGERKI
jgi:CRP/FNR family transcriptional regulator, cyclic AMP receptor protein